MPKWSMGAAGAVVVAGFFSGGCAVQREPLVLVEPEFSYLRDGERPLDATLAELDLAPVELADAPFLDSGVPLELTEPSLLRPARTMVQSDEPQPQP